MIDPFSPESLEDPYELYDTLRVDAPEWLGALDDLGTFYAQFAGRVPAEVRPTRALGVAGTITQLATLDLGLEREEPDVVHGHPLATKTVTAQLERLSALSVDEIRRELRGGLFYRLRVRHRDNSGDDNDCAGFPGAGFDDGLPVFRQ